MFLDSCQCCMTPSKKSNGKCLYSLIICYPCIQNMHTMYIKCLFYSPHIVYTAKEL